MYAVLIHEEFWEIFIFYGLDLVSQYGNYTWSGIFMHNFSFIHQISIQMLTTLLQTHNTNSMYIMYFVLMFRGDLNSDFVHEFTVLISRRETVRRYKPCV